jgi:hypothetical protein
MDSPENQVDSFTLEECTFPYLDQVEDVLEYYWTDDKKHRFDINDLIKEIDGNFFPSTDIPITDQDRYYIKAQHRIYEYYMTIAPQRLNQHPDAKTTVSVAQTIDNPLWTETSNTTRKNSATSRSKGNPSEKRSVSFAQTLENPLWTDSPHSSGGKAKRQSPKKSTRKSPKKTTRKSPKK